MSRVDAWVWAVRLMKTRTAASAACRAGHIKVNDTPVKPAHSLKIGDRVRVWNNHRETIVEVTQIISRRVSAEQARQCYVDHSPPPPDAMIIASMPRRDRGAGRPTKKERRQLDRVRGRR